MKKFFKVLGILTVVALAAYAAYLCYDKFLKKKDDDLDDLEDWGYEFEDEEAEQISFTDRVKAAAERQLARVK